MAPSESLDGLDRLLIYRVDAGGSKLTKDFPSNNVKINWIDGSGRFERK